MKQKEVLLFFSLILLSFSLMGLDKLGWLDWLKRPMEKLSSPIRERIYKQEIEKLRNEEIKGIDVNILLENLEQLEREKADLKVKLVDLEQENASMRRLLGAPLPLQWQFIPAQVLSITNGIMTINQGADLGIKQDQVVVFENVLIGQVIKVNPGLSKIKLITHKETNIKTKVKKTNVRGIVKTETADLFLDEVLQEESLAQGQIVVTSGEEEIYPANLLIGKIDSVEKNEAAVYQKARLQPLVGYKSLTHVFVVKQ